MMRISNSSAGLLCLSALVFLLLGGCGTETGNPIIGRPKTPRLVAQDTTEAELQELSESVLDSGPIPPTPTAGSYVGRNQQLVSFEDFVGTSDESLQLSEHSSPLQLNSSFSCSGDQSRVTGRVVRNIETSKEFRKSGSTVTKVVAREQNFTIDSPLGALSCSQERGVRFRPRLLEGTTETREGSSKRTVNRTGEIKAKHYRSAEFSSLGKRTKKFERVVVDAGTVRVERTVEWSLEKKSRISTSEGDSTDQSKSITVPGKPIRIVVEYTDDEGITARSKTIQSGTTLTTHNDGSQVEISFENISFANQECYPTSGILRGKLTPATSSGSQPETFTIDFADKSAEIPEIAFGDGEKTPLSGTCVD
jgi:hypothetical protein